jgi:DNA-binding NarL/FixJ family response regulator
MFQKVILADDHPVFRAGAARILAVEEDIRIIAQAATFASLHRAVTSFHHSVVVFGASILPSPDALNEALRISRGRGIVVIENNETSERYLKQGMLGVVTRKIHGNDLVTCVRRVSRGELYVKILPESNTDPLPNELHGARILQKLTSKELLILSYVIQGHKNKEIAPKLNTSVQVIKNHLTSIFTKTGTSDRLELALFTIHNKVLAEAVPSVEGFDLNDSPQVLRHRRLQAANA